MLVAAFILSMVSSVPTKLSKELDLASIKLSCLIVEYLGRSKSCRYLRHAVKIPMRAG